MPTFWHLHLAAPAQLVPELLQNPTRDGAVGISESWTCSSEAHTPQPAFKRRVAFKRPGVGSRREQGFQDKHSDVERLLFPKFREKFACLGCRYPPPELVIRQG